MELISRHVLYVKKVIYSILEIFASTYGCKSLFSAINLIKSKQRKTLTNKGSTACISLKITYYSLDIKTLSAKKQ